MQPTKKQRQEMLQTMFKSSVRHSYFNSFNNNKYTQKSKIQTEEIAEQQDVDENTFRMMAGFVRPDDGYAVYEKVGLFYMEEEGFFACMSTRKRYQVQLKNFKLKVMYNDKLKYFFNFETENVDITAKGNHFIITVDSCDQKFYFQPAQDDWVKLIQKVINSSDGKIHKFNYLPDKDKHFYSQIHISNQEFEKSANSLDIVLFKSEHSAAAVQRLFTNSEYDHVGIVLRNRKNQIIIYQSTSNQGVGFTSWKDMIKYQWHKSTDKISWRRLDIKLSPEDIHIIEAFVAKTVGKQFQINLEKLFMFSSTLKRSPEEEEKKTYFCSQLAARLYKELGLIDPKKASTSYYPVDFSQKVSIDFKRQGVKFQPERVISFNKTK